MEILIYHPVLRAPDAVLEEAPRLEALGFDGMVMPDHLYVLDFQSGVPLPYPHPLPVLSAAAAVTRRLKLLALVSNNLARGPVELAQQTATLANLAPGRVELAIGAGWFEAEHVAAGVGFPRGADRVRRLVESVSICRSLFADSTVDHDGEHYQVSIPIGGFIPVEATIPIMVGAAAPAMIRAAAQVADRVDLQPDALTGGGADLRQYNSYTFELLASGVDRAQQAAAAAGRVIRVSASPFVLITADETEGAHACQEMADFLALDVSIVEASFGTLIGSPEEVGAKLDRYVEAGCDRVHLQALNAEAATARRPAASQAPSPLRPTMEAWRIPGEQRGRQREIELFCDRASAPPGGEIRVLQSSSVPTHLTIWRLGHEGGAGGRLVADLGPLPPTAQSPARFSADTGFVSCAHWEPTCAFTVESSWASGVYAVRADTTTVPARSADAIFVVTSPEPGDVTVVLPVTTWAAYNLWGGRSLYDGGGFNGLPRANAVSLDRPMHPIGSPIWEATQGHPFFTWEYPLVRWLEREGFEPSYVTSLEVQRGELPRTGLIISAGHDEYWSGAMRDTLDQSLAAGSSLLWAGANGLCWNIRLEPSALGEDRTMTCYKDHLSDPLIDTAPAQVTGRWGEWPLFRSESDTLGVRWVDWDFALNRRPASWTVRAGDHPIFEGTGLRTGDRVPGIVGDEWDAFDPQSPAATTAVVLGETEELTGANLGPSRGHTVLHRTQAGGLVLASGTTSWCWGLDASTVEDRETVADPRLQKLTRAFITAALNGADW